MYYSSIASIITRVVGYCSLNCVGMVALTNSCGGHKGVSFSFKCKKLINVHVILLMVDSKI